jgi:hypothetical protein
MGGSGGTTDTENTPWKPAQRQLEDILTEAQDLYGDRFQFFPGSTTAQKSDLTAAGLSQVQEFGQPSFVDDASNFLGQTLRGEFLGGQGQNPELDNMFELMSGRIGQQYQRITQPGIATRFGGSGRMGSPAEARARGVAQEGLGRSLSDAATQVYYGDYNARRQDQISALGLAPGVRATQRGDAAQLFAGGQVEEAYEQQGINEQISRFAFAQEEPWQRLERYQQLITGASRGYGTAEVPSSGPSGSQTGLGAAMSLMGMVASMYTGGASGAMVAGMQSSSTTAFG